MPFSWMQSSPSGERRHPVSDDCGEVYRAEVRQRAGLLRRLGYSKAHAVHRCLGNISWAFSTQGRPPISAKDVRLLVTEIYDR